jgi:hypothetical protein
VSDPLIASPVPGSEAFAGDEPNRAWSQAAQIIGAARQLAGDRGFPDDNAYEFQVLEIPSLGELDSGLAAYVERAWSEARIGRLAEVAGRTHSSAAVALVDGVQGEFWRRSRDGDPVAAAALVASGLFRPSETIRLAAAASIGVFAPELSAQRFFAPRSVEPVVDTLADGCFSANGTLATMCADALLVANPEHPLLEFITADRDLDVPGPGHTSLMIHGMWARWPGGGLPPGAAWVRQHWRTLVLPRDGLREPWWKPGGDFHGYVKEKVATDLYATEPVFSWPGGFRSESRGQAATDLITWCQRRGIKELNDVYAHSFGGEVAFLAANKGLRIRLLVLMSVPSLPAGNWGNIGRAVSLRSHFDFALMLGHSNRRHPVPVSELELPLWFGHSVTHDVDMWRRFGLDSEMAFQRGLSLW